MNDLAPICEALEHLAVASVVGPDKARVAAFRRASEAIARIQDPQVSKRFLRAYQIAQEQYAEVLHARRETQRIRTMLEGVLKALVAS